MGAETLPVGGKPRHPEGALIVRIARQLNDLGVGTMLDLDALAVKLDVPTEAYARRLRDLPRLGWVIDSTQTDPTLAPHQYRLVKIGAPIWERGVRRTQRAVSVMPDLSDLSVEDARALGRLLRGDPLPRSVTLFAEYQRLGKRMQRKFCEEVNAILAADALGEA